MCDLQQLYDVIDNNFDQLLCYQTDMTEWQRRLVQEYNQLNERINKLQTFLDDQQSIKSLDDQYVDLMKSQLHHMCLYSVDLYKRLKYSNLID